MDEGEGQLSQFAEVQAVRMAIDVALQRKYSLGYTCILTPGWWPMPSGAGSHSGNRGSGRDKENLFGW